MHKNIKFLSEEQLRSQYGFDFYEKMTEDEKNDPTINIFDNMSLMIIEGKDFNLDTIKIKTHSPKTCLFNVYEYRSKKPFRRVIRFLTC
jgi:hypothetical protein